MNRRLQLIKWVKDQHEGQLIKETNLPYFDHVITVANMAESATSLTYEIGICHDLLEKTTATEPILRNELVAFGYNNQEANHIVNCVVELTRHFTKETNPLPKKERKELDEERLLTISADAQTVKYADLSYNADWMMQFDKHHAPAYLRRKIELISEMTAGDAALQEKTLHQLKEFLQELD